MFVNIQQHESGCGAAYEYPCPPPQRRSKLGAVNEKLSLDLTEVQIVTQVRIGGSPSLAFQRLWIAETIRALPSTFYAGGIPNHLGLSRRSVFDGIGGGLGIGGKGGSHVDWERLRSPKNFPILNSISRATHCSLRGALFVVPLASVGFIINDIWHDSQTQMETVLENVKGSLSTISPLGHYVRAGACSRSSRRFGSSLVRMVLKTNDVWSITVSTWLKCSFRPSSYIGVELWSLVRRFYSDGYTKVLPRALTKDTDFISERLQTLVFQCCPITEGFEDPIAEIAFHIYPSALQLAPSHPLGELWQSDHQEEAKSGRGSKHH